MLALPAFVLYLYGMAHLPQALRHSWQDSRFLLEHWLEDPEARCEPDPERHVVRLLSPDLQLRAELRLPLPLGPLPAAAAALPAYLGSMPDTPQPYLMALVQLGAAAMGYFEDGEPLAHKAFKKYMKRHKQGRAQINYLKTRGKSKAGSRVRLANTIDFFEEVNERLTAWETQYHPPRILYSCTAQVWGLMFQSNVPPPFEKKDPRLIKIPLDVDVPTFEELLNVNGLINCGWERRL